MNGTIHPSDPTLPSDETEVLQDRRRPGRADVEPVLVPLLLETGHVSFSQLEQDRLLDEDVSDVAVDCVGEGSIIKGLLFGLTLSLPFWLVAAFVCALMSR